MNIGIIGNGFVGKATKLLKCLDINVKVYDIKKELCEPLGTSLDDINNCDLVFICVPTPMNKDGSSHLDILKSVVNKLNNKYIVIRSTVPPGTSDKLNCYFMPEFLTEKNFKYDFQHNLNWIFGTKDNNIEFKNRIKKLIHTAYINKRIFYNKIHFVPNKEAEMIKLFKNSFLATKVSFCNEINEFCKLQSINYEDVRRLATLDPRIGSSHSFVPGHDGKYGYGGTCFPKDVHGLNYEIRKINMKSYVIDSVIKRNEQVDRKEKDWNSNKGRSVI